MKVTSIELTNFKAIGERVVIPVRPITLLFGANSAGKSSILQCLAMLAQSGTIEMEDASLYGIGPLVDAGNFRDFIHQHDTTKPFECKFNFNLDVEKLFYIDEYLPHYIMPTRFRFLNDSATKMKKTLATFRETALSFCFHYDNSEKSINLDKINFFLDDNTNPVFSYTPSDWGFTPNTDHVFWETYWKMFRSEIYKKLYDYHMALRDRIVRDISEKSHLSEQEKLRQLAILFRMEYNHQSLIEICCLLEPEDPFYRQLQEESQQGKNEFELVFRMYIYMFSSLDAAETQYLTEFSGFLPSRFNHLKPAEFLCLKFNNNMHGGGNIDLFHPEQLVVLVAWHVKAYLDLFSFMGPLRKRPERFYVEEDTTTKASERGGDDNAFLLLAYKDDLVRQVNLELDQLHTGYQIQIVHLTDQEVRQGSGVFLLQFINQKTGVAASIKDVGFGFSQILPIIVQSRRAFHSTILIEQPELHLHPALQAELGDFFIRGALGTDTENSGYVRQKHNRFFIETHSEHLILRLLRRIRETTDDELPDNVPPLTPDDIAVLYVQPGPNGSEVIHIPVTTDGEFACPWPGGFFSERAKELF